VTPGSGGVGDGEKSDPGSGGVRGGGRASRLRLLRTLRGGGKATVPPCGGSKKWAFSPPVFGGGLLGKRVAQIRLDELGERDIGLDPVAAAGERGDIKVVNPDLDHGEAAPPSVAVETHAVAG